MSSSLLFVGSRAVKSCSCQGADAGIELLGEYRHLPRPAGDDLLAEMRAREAGGPKARVPLQLPFVPGPVQE
ncbi:MAG: hypothetical protein M0Z46_22785 [Actinomycetota bacterium]|nr:hypothetical protein [Actinomycetota bacterium]